MLALTFFFSCIPHISRGRRLNDRTTLSIDNFLPCYEFSRKQFNMALKLVIHPAMFPLRGHFFFLYLSSFSSASTAHQEDPTDTPADPPPEIPLELGGDESALRRGIDIRTPS